MRRIISLLLALILVVVGIYWAVHIWMYAEVIYAKALLAPIFMIVIGCIWLYADFIGATPPAKS